MHTMLKTRTAGSGPNLVLLHGWGVNSGVWQPIAAQLEQQFSVTYVDLPGFGENYQALSKPYDLANLAASVASVIPENSLLAGWSLGGLVAQKIALHEPAKVSQLVLIASSPKFQKSDDWPGIEPTILQTFSQQLVKNLSKTIDRFLAIQAMGSDSAKTDIKKIKSSIEASPQADIAALTAGLKILEQVDLRTELASLTMPVHWMLGRLDSLVPAKLNEYVQQKLPSNHSVSVFPHASHAPFISHTEHFLADFMAAFNESTLK
ncbi:Pimeloyl-[acyl-carrier protein] methyl ester esterase [Paraglaciecola mesophila]|uniref:Pimeloyl-[acyl-carrier protein] methyl ester esterase n=1 Tax=Paraglaciecola mesophila TaxID=197222 RepID=A0A857JM96_9ALTE|nr:pimeloyl-ACP methyl ester esterase BioH [Paraglaciecola mesophila]QHJ12462.1 Pimeloyl-[acyl-carrier protein] methyl ester esterase [Paraglaciecola mesophila]